MRHTQFRRGGRPAFTLVELLVVIAIIAVLVALTAAAVFGVIGRGTETRTKIELDQLTAAVNAAKLDYGVKYLPSRIVLRRDNNYNTSDLVYGVEHARTIKFLQQMFPKIDLTPMDPKLLPPGVTTPGIGIDWSNEGLPVKMYVGGDDSKGNYVLYGDQALVFFLGGIPSKAVETKGCNGFSTNPRNPADLTPGTTRKGPYYDFASTRLLRSATNNFFRYMDLWNDPTSTAAMPYLYFSTYGSDNSYHVASLPKDPTGDCPPGLKDLLGKPLVVTPYYEAPLPPLTPPPGRFTNPSSFQIISAGKDGEFGPGGFWDPSKGSKNVKGQTLDDQANFGGATLGAPVK
jgi:prepilin-type N-terminal cleavage/methylation domain-containing protein